MRREAVVKIVHSMGVGLLFCSILACPACDRKGVGSGSHNSSRSDPLIGKWVMIGDNGTDANGTIADYRSDGTVVFIHRGKTRTSRYKREPGKTWADRRAGSLGLRAGGDALEEFRKPGVEMIQFPDPDGTFMDHGGSLLTLDPSRRLLYNPLTQVW